MEEVESLLSSGGGRTYDRSSSSHAPAFTHSVTDRADDAAAEVVSVAAARGGEEVKAPRGRWITRSEQATDLHYSARSAALRDAEPNGGGGSSSSSSSSSSSNNSNSAAVNRTGGGGG